MPRQCARKMIEESSRWSFLTRQANLVIAKSRAPKLINSLFRQGAIAKDADHNWTLRRCHTCPLSLGRTFGHRHPGLHGKGSAAHTPLTRQKVDGGQPALHDSCLWGSLVGGILDIAALDV